MELVKQRKPTDCGIACAAMLAGVPYEVAEAAFDFGKRTRTRRTNETAMYRALRKLGLKAKLPLVSGAPQRSPALLKCNRTQRRVAKVKRWHWCVQTPDGRVLDPLDDGKSRPILAHMPVGL